MFRKITYATAKLWMVLVVFMLLGANTIAYGGSLEVQRANISACIERIKPLFGLEKSIRLCSVKRLRSLLFKGEGSVCSHPQSSSSVSCSAPDSVTANGASDTHVPSTASAAPIERDKIGQAYAGYVFWVTGKRYQITAENWIQRWRNNRWENLCRLNNSVNCFYEIGQNSTLREIARRRYRLEGKCNYYSISFAPSLTHIQVLETISRIGLTNRPIHPVFGGGTERIYHCEAVPTNHRIGWIRGN
ncbi:MAG: hypothetical protein ACNYNY_00110 [Candidatus Oxydemutatoraceae bacterium WSBS_2016_MAG_OTU14]